MPDEKPDEKPKDDGPTKESPGDTTEVGRQLSFVGKFIDKYYLKQPTWIQNLTFLVFVVLFACGFFNVLTGKYVLSGVLYAEGADKCGQTSCVNLASFYDVRWGTADFASNLRGEYSVTLSFLDYARAVASGSHDLSFFDGKGQMAFTGSVKILRMDGEFDKVTIPYRAPAAPPPGPGARNQGPNEFWTVVPAAWASDQRTYSGVYQLLVQGIRVAPGVPKGSALLTMTMDNETTQMHDHSLSDYAAGGIPVTADQSIDLGSNLFFPVPATALPVGGQLHMSIPATGFFQISSYSEDFPLPSQQTAGEVLQLSGSRGSVLFVRFVFSQSVKMYREANWAQQKDALEAAFLKQGFLVRWADPPLGALAETNALWTGPLVPFDVTERLIRVATDQGILLKKIAYRYHFQSTQNQTEMQIGSSGACAKSEPIPVEVLREVTAAPSEEEFQRLISPFTCGTTPARRQPERARHR